MTVTSQALDRQLFDVRVIRGARIPTGDGNIALGADVYLPVTDIPVPALITIMHNAKDGIAGVGGLPYLRYFAARGYASLIVDRQGTGSSDGAERPPFDPGDGADGFAAVEWAAAQPWCTGNVGMWGMSYGAIYTLATARLRPTALRAIVPLMGTIDPGRDLVHPGGARGSISYFGLAAVWNVFIQLMPPRSPDGSFDTGERWAQRVAGLRPWLLAGWQRPPGDSSWDESVIDATAITAPALCFAGWHDVFLDGSVRAYEQISAPKRLVVGPWLHELPSESPQQPIDWLELACQWWRRWLHDPRPAEDADESAMVFARGERSNWTAYPTWPPQPAEERTYVATANGELRTTPVDGAGATTLWSRCDPTVGALSGLVGVPMAGFGFPLDQHDDDLRSLTISTEPIPEPLLVAGRPTAHLALDAATDATRCVVKLVDVDERGRSTLVSMGVTALADGPDRLRTVELSPTCYEIAAGHRLALVLADSDVPRLWPASTPAALGVRTAVTAVTLPLCSAGDTREAARPSVLDNELLASAQLPRAHWTIARDHAAGAVTVTVGATGFGGATPVDPGDQLSVDVVVGMGVGPDEHGGTKAWLTGTGSLSITTAAGQHVLTRATTEVTAERATVLGEVIRNDVPVFTKRWFT